MRTSRRKYLCSFTLLVIAIVNGSQRFAMMRLGKISFFFRIPTLRYFFTTYYSNSYKCFVPYKSTYYTSRNWPKCKHFIYDYMWLLVICNYIWTFLQLFLVLVIFAITLQLVCNYFGVHPSMWTTFSLVFTQVEQFISHWLQMSPI